MSYTVRRTHLDSQQRLVRKGEKVDLTDREAQDKIRRGLVEPVGGQPGGKPKPPPRENKVEKPEQGGSVRITRRKPAGEGEE